MKDRPITQDEINKITEKAPLREKAFFTIMRQSGLPPHVVKRLRIHDVEKILEPYTIVPCRITLPNEKTPNFIGYEAVNYVKQYLAERIDPKPEDLLFIVRNRPNKEINAKDVSRIFATIVRRLTKANKITCEIRKGRPSELRLYSLKKFYEENAKNYLIRMRASLNDTRFCRKLYQSEAMPHLEIELPTPIQMHQLKDRLAHIEKTVQETYTPVRRLYYEISGLIPDDEDILFETLKPNIPEKNDEDREQRIQKTLHRLVERMREEDTRASQDESRKS